MPAVRPTELKAVVEVLLNGVDATDRTEEMLAEARAMGTDIMHKIDQLRVDRTDWYLLCRYELKGAWAAQFAVHGPYITQNAALKALTSGDVQSTCVGDRWYALQRGVPIELTLVEESGGVSP